MCLCITVIIITEMEDLEDYYQDDYYFIPDIFNETKTKCCSEGNILAEVTGVWSCIKYAANIEDVLSLFTKIDNSSLSSEIQIEADSDIIDKVCNKDEDVSVLSPSTVDFTDDFAMSNDEEVFFECIDVTRDILADHINPVVVSCIEKDDSLLTCESGGTERIFYLIFGIVSILAIFTSLIVYAVLPKQLLNIHGKVCRKHILLAMIYLKFLQGCCWKLYLLLDVPDVPDDHVLLLLDIVASSQHHCMQDRGLLWLLLHHGNVLLDVFLVSRLVLHFLQIWQVYFHLCKDQAYLRLNKTCVQARPNNV